MPRKLLDELKDMYDNIDKNPTDAAEAAQMILAMVKGYMIGIGEWDEEFSDNN